MNLSRIWAGTFCTLTRTAAPYSLSNPPSNCDGSAGTDLIKIGVVREDGPAALLHDCNRAMRAHDLERAVRLVGRLRKGQRAEQRLRDRSSR